MSSDECAASDGGTSRCPLWPPQSQPVHVVDTESSTTATEGTRRSNDVDDVDDEGDDKVEEAAEAAGEAENGVAEAEGRRASVRSGLAGAAALPTANSLRPAIRWSRQSMLVIPSEKLNDDDEYNDDPIGVFNAVVQRGSSSCSRRRRRSTTYYRHRHIPPPVHVNTMNGTASQTHSVDE